MLQQNPSVLNWACLLTRIVMDNGRKMVVAVVSPQTFASERIPGEQMHFLTLQPDTVQAAVSYESTSQEINVVRDLIDNHQQLFGVSLSTVAHFS